MNRRNRLLPADLIWACGITVLLVLQFWWLPGERGSASDSYSVTADGQLGIYRILSQLFDGVRRLDDRLLPDDRSTMLLIAPIRNPSASEERLLHEFVVRGGRLLFVPGRADPERMFPLLGFELKRRAADDATSEQKIECSLISNPPVWRSAGFLSKIAEPFDSVVTSDSDTEVFIRPVGDGLLMVCTSADVFSNRSMLFADSRELAVRLIEFLHTGRHGTVSGDPSTITVNEYLNGSSSYRGSGVLFSPLMRIGTLQLGIVALLWLWSGFHRFGPMTSADGGTRRSLADSARAAGNLQFQLRDGGSVVQGYLDYVSHQLRRHFGGTLRLDHPEQLARRSGMESEHVRHLLGNLRKLVETDHVSQTKAAQAIRWLAQLQQKILNPTGTRTDESE